MALNYPTPPSNLRSLRDRLNQAARREGVLFGRLQQHVAVLVVAQFASSVTDDSGIPLLLVKGGSASSCAAASRTRARRKTSTP